MSLKSKDVFAREHALSAVIGIFFAVVAYFPLKNFAAIGEAGAAYLGLLCAILSVLIADRIFYQSRLRELQEFIHDALIQSQGFESTSRYFKSTLEALDYVHTAIPKAVRIWNTRLYDSRGPRRTVILSCGNLSRTTSSSGRF